MGIFAAYKRASQLAKSHRGCDFGWIVEWNGRPIAELDDWRSEEMFWTSYRVTCTSEADRAVVQDPTHWECGDFVFVNRVMDVRIKDVLAGKNPDFVSNGRVILRGVNAFPLSRTEGWLLNFLEPFFRPPLPKS